MSVEMHNEIQRLRETMEKQAGCLSKLLEHAKERDIKVGLIVDQMTAIAAQNNEMYKPFKDAVTVSRWLSFLIKWAFGTLLAIGGAYLMIKQIIGHE